MNLTVPYSESAEKAVLGSLLCQPDETIDEVRLIIGEKKDAFFVPAHQEIYEALLDLHDNGSGIEMMLVHEYLTSKKMAESVQSPGILADLLTSFATHLNATEYAKIVRDKKILRDLLDSCESTSKEALETYQPVAQILERAQSRINSMAEVSHPKETPFGEIIKKTASEIVFHSQMGGGLAGLPTGFKRINEITGGWRKGQLIVIGARPSQGKSALALTFAKALLRNQWNEEGRSFCDPGYPGGMFSLEMTEEELSYRLLSAQGALSLTSFYNGGLGDNEQHKIKSVAENISSWPFYIDAHDNLDITQIQARARRWKRKHDIQWLMVDYLQLVKSRAGRKDGRTEEVADVARNLKRLARELDIPIIALAQLNRNVQDEEPQLYHLKESGAIEQDADLVFLLHELEEESDHDGLLKRHILHLAKQRNGKRGTKLKIEFRAWCTLFVDPRED